jgi:hypothetical protein
VAVRVFRGNSADQTTVLEQARIICDEYGVKAVAFVGDRGRLTPKRIEELHALGYKTLTALTHPQMRDLLQRRVVQLELFNEQEWMAATSSAARLPRWAFPGHGDSRCHQHARHGSATDSGSAESQVAA